MENVFAPTAGNSGTPCQRTVKLFAVSSKMTVPPAAGIQVIPQARDSRRPVQVGQRRFRERAAGAAEGDAAVGVHEQRREALPQKSIGKRGNSSTKPSSPTGSGSPASGTLKMTLTPVRVAPAAADTAAKVPGAIAVRLGGAAVELLRSRQTRAAASRSRRPGSRRRKPRTARRESIR